MENERGLTMEDVVAGIDGDIAAKTIEVDVIAVLGTAQLQVAQLLKLGRGAVVELDRRTSDPIDLYVNRVRIAKGEVVVVEDHIAVTITETLKMR